MKHARFLPGSVMIRPIYLSLYMLWSHLVLLLSLPWDSRTNEALLYRHERRSISPADDAILNGLDSLEDNFAVLLDSYDGFPPVHHSVPELPAPTRGGNYDHFPPPTESIAGLLTKCEVGSRPNDYPSSVSGQSEEFWRLLLSQLDGPSSTRQTTSSTAEPNAREEIQPSKPSASLALNPFPSNEVGSIRGSGSTTQVPGMSQNHYYQNQDVGSSQEESKTSESNEPVAGRLKRKHSDLSAHSKGSLRQETFSVLSNQGVTLKRQKYLRSDAEASQKVGQTGKSQSRQDGNAPEKRMQSTNRTVSREAKATACLKASVGAHTLSEPNSLVHPSSYKLYKTTVEDTKFLNGLLDSNPKMRLSALQNYIQEVWPQATFTGTESFEGMKEYMEKRARLVGRSRNQSKLSLGQKEPIKEKTFDHFQWGMILGTYRNDHRPEMLKWGEETKKYDRSLKLHLLCAQAGAQRLDQLGIYTRIDKYFSEMEDRLLGEGKDSGLKKGIGLSRKVQSYAIPAREATISMLYQVELILRLSTPLLKDDEPRHQEYLIELMKHTEDFWSELHPFNEKTGNQLKEHGPERSENDSLSPLQKIKKLMEGKLGLRPCGLRIARLLLKNWCLDKNFVFFEFLKEDVKAIGYGNFNAMLADCTVYDLLHMIA